MERTLYDYEVTVGFRYREYFGEGGEGGYCDPWTSGHLEIAAESEERAREIALGYPLEEIGIIGDIRCTGESIEEEGVYRTDIPEECKW